MQWSDPPPLTNHPLLVSTQTSLVSSPQKRETSYNPPSQPPPAQTPLSHTDSFPPLNDPPPLPQTPEQPMPCSQDLSMTPSWTTTPSITKIPPLATTIPSN